MVVPLKPRFPNVVADVNIDFAFVVGLCPVSADRVIGMSSSAEARVGDADPDARELADRLAAACHAGDLLSAQAALADGASVNEKGVPTGNYDEPVVPLYAAVFNGDLPTVLWLLARGADPNGDQVRVGGDDDDGKEHNGYHRDDDDDDEGEGEGDDGDSDGDDGDGDGDSDRARCGDAVGDVDRCRMELPGDTPAADRRGW